MAGVFITGTDTEVGKTVVTGLLGHTWQAQGLRVITQKWVQSGCVDFSEDIDIHLKLMGRSRDFVQDVREAVCPYLFELPASGHLAAEAQGNVIDPAVIKHHYHSLERSFDRVLVEGMGGLLVPYSRRALIVDLVQDLNLPVLIVTKNKLGAINHTLLTIEALQRRDIPILGIVFNGPKGTDNAVTQDNPRIVQEISGIPILGELPWTDDLNQLKAAFGPVSFALTQAFEKQGAMNQPPRCISGDSRES